MLTVIARVLRMTLRLPRRHNIKAIIRIGCMRQVNRTSLVLMSIKSAGLFGDPSDRISSFLVHYDIDPLPRLGTNTSILAWRRRRPSRPQHHHLGSPHTVSKKKKKTPSSTQNSAERGGGVGFIRSSTSQVGDFILADCPSSIQIVGSSYQLACALG